MNRIFMWLGSWFIRPIAPPEPPEPPDVQQDRASIPPLPPEGWAWWYVFKPGIGMEDGTKELAAVQICKGSCLKRRLVYILELRRRSRAAGYILSLVHTGSDSPFNSVNENHSVKPPAVSPPL